jgi:multiple sugar transport system substrate-binding protein
MSEQDRSPRRGTDPIIRREFMRRSSAALGAAAGATLLEELSTRRARAQDRTEITFASAKFFGKETIAEVVEADLHLKSAAQADDIVDQ